MKRNILYALIFIGITVNIFYLPQYSETIGNEYDDFADSMYVNNCRMSDSLKLNNRLKEELRSKLWMHSDNFSRFKQRKLHIRLSMRNDSIIKPGVMQRDFINLFHKTISQNKFYSNNFTVTACIGNYNYQINKYDTIYINTFHKQAK